jgi:hypothetical protein
MGFNSLGDYFGTHFTLRNNVFTPKINADTSGG